MAHYLVTGASGFFGGVLKRRLLREEHTCVNVDLEIDEDAGAAGLTSVQGDLRDRALMERIFQEHRFDAIFHCAAQLAHGMRMDEHLLWTSNVDATRLLAELAVAHSIRPFVFISTNCLWASNLGHPVNEAQDMPEPIEIYGRSKLAAEQVLEEFTDRLDVVILRVPTIMDEGRLGLLAILYEFIDDHKTVWVVGDGMNQYQFVYADDLVSACLLAEKHGRSGLFHLGSDDVQGMRAVYESVIRASGSRSKVRSLPKGPTIAAMIAAHKLRVSPLGPYHYKMIAESFVFDTAKAKKELGWSPTMTNQDMLLRAYSFYKKNRKEIAARTDVSAHRKPASMGIIRLLKWIS
ncbi:NAD-dependent epimerase/dehydratase family protein [Terriglobus saanensis]|uniref:NAD-dependent epimerase/dehydratase n=1 Tax=Terriglobus saanensis (strain ATCC BAA-1853 / DSM 23119 / SP1PR4) TaxID=401053 RepID=E8V3L4_TERSS|nr:NAD(P)-dependent oxidoreductase [Terriglobus saanensis]ADV84701.1 NAD-dependent epimerase/dehydratase [Terriglobus saanensis SP1PR4]